MKPLIELIQSLIEFYPMSLMVLMKDFYVFQNLSDEYRSSVFMKNFKSNLINSLPKITSMLKKLETSKVGKFSLTSKVHVF